MMKQRYVLRPLRADERPRHRYRYYVTGTGEFPFDMLRYDAAWPADSTAAAKMGGDWGAGMRSVELCSYREPTIDRWSSFTWSVGMENLGAF